MTEHANFHIGQVVIHELFGYRGAIYEIDPIFMLSAQWYEQMAKSRPPKDKPWYHVLVDNGIHNTYVAQQNLRAEIDPEPIKHPALDEVFKGFHNGKYQLRKQQLQ